MSIDVRRSMGRLIVLSRRGSQTSLSIRKRSIGSELTKESAAPLLASPTRPASTIVEHWFRKPQHSLLIGVLILVTGSIFFYRFAFSTNRNR